MRRILGWATLLAGLAMALPAAGADDNKKKSDKDDAKDNAKEKLVPVGRITGKVGQVEGSARNLTLQVSLSYPVPARVGRLITYQVRTVTQSVDLTAADDIKVRVPKPPAAFDDKGNPKKYTAKELRELKGPGNLPGYTGDFDNVRTGQVVQVYLAKKKEALKPAAKKKKGEEQEPTDSKPLVSMIVILVDPQN